MSNVVAPRLLAARDDDPSDIWDWYQFQRQVLGEEIARASTAFGSVVPASDPALNRYLGKTPEDLTGLFADQGRELDRLTMLGLLAATEGVLQRDFFARRAKVEGRCLATIPGSEQAAEDQEREDQPRKGHPRDMARARSATEGEKFRKPLRFRARPPALARTRATLDRATRTRLRHAGHPRGPRQPAERDRHLNLKPPRGCGGRSVHGRGESGAQFPTARHPRKTEQSTPGA